MQRLPSAGESWQGRPAVGLAATLILLGALIAWPQANTLRVPEDYPTIQAAVNAAGPGDQIRVGPGSWCGATITKPVDLLGEGGATIVGCEFPSLLNGLRTGFLLLGARGSGATIRHFVFEGRGVSNLNLDPLAFAVYSFDASNVIVEQNRILGTVQGVTNTGGGGWMVSHNEIEGLTAFTCEGFCGGGVGVVFQQRDPEVPRALDNSATFNRISGAVPDGLYEFSMAGISILGQDGVVIKNNRISLAGNPAAPRLSRAVIVSDASRESITPFQTSVNSVIVNNEASGSELAVVVDRDFGRGTGNASGSTIRGNSGSSEINTTSSSANKFLLMTLVPRAKVCAAKFALCFLINAEPGITFEVVDDLLRNVTDPLGNGCANVCAAVSKIPCTSQECESRCQAVHSNSGCL